MLRSGELHIVMQAGDKARLALQISGPTGIEVEQLLQCIRLRDAVSVRLESGNCALMMLANPAAVRVVSDKPTGTFRNE